MSAVAQKQDLSDPEVMRAFAAHGRQTERRLVALYLLTVADIRGTSPKVWNAWKGKLLEDLFRADAARARAARRRARRGARRRSRPRRCACCACTRCPTRCKDSFWAQLDIAYFLRHDAQEIAWQTRNLHYRVDTERPVVKARLSPIGEGLQVMIYTPDREALFARICGYFERDRLQHRRSQDPHHAPRLRAGHLPGARARDAARTTAT